MSIILEEKSVVIEKQNNGIKNTIDLDEMASDDRELLEAADLATGWTKKRKNNENTVCEKKICLSENTDSLVTFIF
jgi:hypothetical protein